MMSEDGAALQVNPFGSDSSIPNKQWNHAPDSPGLPSPNIRKAYGSDILGNCAANRRPFNWLAQTSLPFKQTSVSSNDMSMLPPGGRGVGGIMCSQSQYNMGDMTAKLDSLKHWSISTYKCTKQALAEKLGKTHRTVDLELEQSVDGLREMQRRYAHLLSLSRGFTAYFQQMTHMQKQLADCFAEMAQNEANLREEYNSNTDSNRTIVRQSDALITALNFFNSTVQTLVEKTIEDTLQTVRLFETARLEYDAYREDLAAVQQSGSQGVDMQAKLQDTELKCQAHKKRYEQLRDDVQIKIRFLDENRTKVMGKQLCLFHNAIAAYFSGNHAALNASLKQFNLTPKPPNSTDPSFLEQSSINK